MKPVGYDELKYSIRILNNGDGSFTVEVPKLPGCISVGKSKSECIANIVEAIDLHIGGMKTIPPIDPIPSIEMVHDEPTEVDRLISLSETCKLLDISDATIRRYIRDGRLPAFNFGKEYKFRIEEISRFIESTRVRPKTSRVHKKTG